MTSQGSISFHHHPRLRWGGGRLQMGAVIAFFDPWCSTSCSGLQAKTFPSFYSEPVYISFFYFCVFSELVSPDSPQAKLAEQRCFF